VYEEIKATSIPAGKKILTMMKLGETEKKKSQKINIAGTAYTDHG